jgi:hypothetical protein
VICRHNISRTPKYEAPQGKGFGEKTSRKNPLQRLRCRWRIILYLWCQHSMPVVICRKPEFKRFSARGLKWILKKQDRRI